jgi:hypothetical protein
MAEILELGGIRSAAVSLKPPGFKVKKRFFLITDTVAN